MQLQAWALPGDALTGGVPSRGARRALECARPSAALEARIHCAPILLYSKRPFLFPGGRFKCHWRRIDRRRAFSGCAKRFGVRAALRRFGSALSLRANPSLFKKAVSVSGRLFPSVLWSYRVPFFGQIEIVGGHTFAIEYCIRVLRATFEAFTAITPCPNMSPDPGCPNVCN